MAGLLQQFAELEIARQKQKHDLDNDPLSVWAAYRAARAANIDLPEWVLEYLDDAASVLEDATAVAADGKTGEDPREIALRALQMGSKRGRGSMFTNRHHHEWWWLAGRVAEEIQKLRSDHNAARVKGEATARVADRLGITTHEVEKAVKKFESVYGDINKIK
jgi:hypothetical protein